MMVIRRCVIAVVVGLLAMAWSAAPALAHAELIASNPAKSATLRMEVVPTGPPGEYSIVYEVLSKDNDLVRGAVTFTLSSAASTSPTALAAPTATAEPDSGVPATLWVVIGAVVVVGAAVMLAARLRRR
jgi:methionine-rich copper-binding protein CopC